MRNPYESYSLGLRLSHRALTRNLDRFVELAAEGKPLPHDLGDFVRLYVEFLEVHHDSEDRFVFPALRQNTAGRTTDAAHLDRWTSEHRDITRVAEEIGRLGDRGGTALQRLSRELRDLLTPHVASEEDVMTPTHLAEMVPAAEFARVMDDIQKANRSRGLAMASFLATSLEPDEQRALLGEAPWIFRKVILPYVGARKMRRFRDYVQTPSIAL
jgi:hemerythrin superfamily protein